ncbi:MAG: reactive intermediate/imine deaminase [Spirochaetales bacterium]|nr:reactive intermediate/imine deaminase [Spirochaetales bacterium]
MNQKMPFSSSLKAGPFVFVSGKIGMNGETGKLAEGGARGQTFQILKNLQAELARYGLDLKDVVKTTVFLTDMRFFEAMNEAYRSGFPEPLPARSCVSVSGLPHPDALVEIELIALAEEQ